MEGKWKSGIWAEEGEGTMEEAGTWWRTLGPVEEMLGKLSEGWRGGRQMGPSLMSKMLKKMALIIVMIVVIRL